MADEQMLRHSCGSPCYAAPEMLTQWGQQHGYVGHPVDVWSCGVTLFAMVRVPVPLPPPPSPPRPFLPSMRIPEPHCSPSFDRPDGDGDAANCSADQVCGFLPFEHTSTSVLYKKIIAGTYVAPPHLSRDAKDIIRKMLCTEVRRDPHPDTAPYSRRTPLSN